MYSGGGVVVGKRQGCSWSVTYSVIKQKPMI